MKISPTVNSSISFLISTIITNNRIEYSVLIACFQVLLLKIANQLNLVQQKIL
jgi:hypothetical protein